jgi:hypothetical protein
MRISVEIPSLDLDGREIDVDCPVCSLETLTTLGEIRRGDIIICRGCHANIWLEDHLAENARLRDRLRKMFKDIGR